MARQRHLLKRAALRTTPRWLIVAALIVTGLSMRTAVTSVGAVLDDLRAGLRFGGDLAGVITTLPVVCFALIGLLAPRLAHRVGEHRLLIAALAIMTVGLLARATAGSVWVFGVLSILALTGGAIGNVLLPSLVKAHFPDRIGPMTAVYTTAMAVGQTAAAGLTVPISDAAGSWRVGVGVWALLSAVAIAPWLAALRGDRLGRRSDESAASGEQPQPQRDRADVSDEQPAASDERPAPSDERPAASDERPGQRAAARLPLIALTRSPTAWGLAVFFGAQSFQAYVSFGWFETFFRDHGMTASEAGWLVAFYSGLAIAVAAVVPGLAVRGKLAVVGQRRLVPVFAGCYAAGYLGMLLAPVGGAWAWMFLSGAGGGMFPLALTMVGLRTRRAETTAALSAFTQGVGYVIAGTGPLLVGVLHGNHRDWAGPFTLLFLMVAVAIVGGWRAARPGYVDDELAPCARLRHTS